MVKLLQNNLLSICIPTYNRAKVLEKSLINIIRLAQPYNIPIYISDNGSTDNTNHIVKRLQNKYEFIYYSKNKTNIGPDRNFEKVLRMSKSKYSWLLGDDDTILDQSIGELLEIISSINNYDVIVANGTDKSGKFKKNYKIETKVYNDKNKLIVDLWYTMTWMSTLVYNKELIEKANFQKYYYTNFMQTCIIFDYLSDKNCLVYWNSQPIVTYPNQETIINGYGGQEIYLFVKQWVDAIFSLPNCYSNNIKKMTAYTTGIKLKSLIGLRAKNYFNYKVFIEYKKYFKYITKAPLFCVYLVSMMPIQITKFIYNIYKKIRN